MSTKSRSVEGLAQGAITHEIGKHWRPFPMTIRTEMHPCPWGPEWYAIDDDSYDSAPDARPMAGVGATEAEAVADLMARLEEVQ
jgi:hypothetical protein